MYTIVNMIEPSGSSPGEITEVTGEITGRSRGDHEEVTEVTGEITGDHGEITGEITEVAGEITGDQGRGQCAGGGGGEDLRAAGCR